MNFFMKMPVDRGKWPQSALRASLTVESALIFPAIILLIAFMIVFSLRIHDSIIVRSDCIDHMYSLLYDSDDISADIDELVQNIHRHSILKNTSSNYDFFIKKTILSAPIPRLSGSIITIDARPVGSLSLFCAGGTATYQNYDAIIKLIQNR